MLTRLDHARNKSQLLAASGNNVRGVTTLEASPTSSAIIAARHTTAAHCSSSALTATRTTPTMWPPLPCSPDAELPSSALLALPQTFNG